MVRKLALACLAVTCIGGAMTFYRAWAEDDPLPAGDRPGRGPERGGPDRGRPEGPPRPPGPPFGLMRALDANADGELSGEEIANAAAALQKLDKNGDGKLTREELAPAPPGFPGGSEGRGRGPEGRGPEGRGPEGRGRDGGPEGRGRDGGERGPGRFGGPGAGAFLERLKQVDADGDGKLSREEAPAPLKLIFDRVDSNGDGQLDRTELARYAEEMVRQFRDRAPGGDRPRGDAPRGEGAGGDKPREEGRRDEGRREPAPREEEGGDE